MTEVLNSGATPASDSPNTSNENSANAQPAEKSVGEVSGGERATAGESTTSGGESRKPSTSTSSRRSSASRNESRRLPVKQNSNRQSWILLIPVVIVLGLLFQFAIFPSGPVPICTDCSAFSSLRSHLVKIGAAWESPPLSIDSLSEELAMIEAAVQSTGLSSFNAGDKDSECVLILVNKFDLRYYDYVQGVISGLVGFGRNDACPQLQELETFTVRLDSLLSKTSKETPRCKELLDWHLQQYSCSARQK